MTMPAENFLTRAWFYITPPTLTLAAIVMLALLIGRKTYTKPMSRASFGMISGYALLMDRFILLQWLEQDSVPQPWGVVLWTYFFITAVYFLYCLVRYHVLPWLAGRYRTLRHWDVDRDKSLDGIA